MRIWIPKAKILEPKDELHFTTRMKGLVKLRAVKRDGVTVARETDWFPNIIVDTGLDRIGASGVTLGAAAVGTGTGTPAATDTGLGTELAETADTSPGNSNTENSSSPYEVTLTKGFRFGEGAAAGNLTEIGIKSAVSGVLWSRALIVDGGGSPTTFVVAVDEYLDVFYTLIIYPPISDVVDTITITGSGSHDIVCRASSLPNDAPDNGIGSTARQISVYDGAIGAVTGLPSGNSDLLAGTVGHATYGAGNFYRDATYTLGLTDGNLAGGITAARYAIYRDAAGAFAFSGNKFQCSFSPAIAKTGSNILTLGSRFSWARA